MKKMLVVIAILAILAMSSFAMAVGTTAGNVNVIFTVTPFFELTAGTTLNMNINSPEFLLGNGDGRSGTPTQVLSNAFTLRSNALAQLTVVPDSKTDAVIQSGGTPVLPYFSPTAWDMTSDAGHGWGLGYGLTCNIASVPPISQSWHFGTDAATSNLVITNIPAGESVGNFSVNTYLDSARMPTGYAGTYVKGVTLAPVGVYTSVLTLTIAATN